MVIHMNNTVSSNYIKWMAHVAGICERHNQNSIFKLPSSG